MNFKNRKILLVGLLALALSLNISTPSFAEGYDTSPDATGAVSDEAEGSSDYVDPSEVADQAQRDTAGSINSGAKDGRKKAIVAAAVSIGVGVAMYKACASSGGTAQMLCVMGGMSMAQAVMNSGAAGGYGGVAGASGWGEMPSFDFDPNAFGMTPEDLDALGYDPTSGQFPGGNGMDNIAGIGSKAFEKFGVKVDPNAGTVTAPDGTEMPMSAFNSDEGMAGLGFSSADIANAKKLIAKGSALGSKGYKVSGMGFDGGGGGGRGMGGGAGMDFSLGDDPLAAYLASLRKGKGQRKPSSVAGMKRVLGNDAIGVKVDNIFEMIKRRYNQKEKNKEFIR